MNSEELCFDWLKRVKADYYSHARLSARYTTWGRGLGLITTILSAVVATTVFSALTKSDNTNILIIAGTISIIAVVVSASHDFLKLRELAERHKQAVSKFGRLRRELELKLLKFSTKSSTKKDYNGNGLSENLNIFNEKWGILVDESPTIPNSFYKKVLEEVEEEAKNWFKPFKIK